MKLQYPHTGRTSCIFAARADRVTRRRIAVPSHGSNFMHLVEYPRPPASDAHIAVPSHGSNFMHPPPSLSRRPARSIAVPSHGSNFMHPEYDASSSRRKDYCSTLTRVELHASPGRSLRHLLAGLLQYPHTGRTSCIGPAVPGDANPVRIAVPSHGSNFMHPERRHRSVRPPTYCSTLTRVELHASWNKTEQRMYPIRLQYPHTGRTSCIRTGRPIATAA